MSLKFPVMMVDDLQVFEKGNFAGVEEMKKNERLFERIAPMGVNDILMAVQYENVERPVLSIPVTSFEGLLDETIDPNNMAQWTTYTRGAYRNVTIMGDHYFVSTHYKQVCTRYTSTSCWGHDLQQSLTLQEIDERAACILSNRKGAVGLFPLISRTYKLQKRTFQIPKCNSDPCFGAKLLFQTQCTIDTLSKDANHRDLQSCDQRQNAAHLCRWLRF